MYTHIMFPVDRTLPPKVHKAADVAAAIAKWQGAKITIVSVTGSQSGDKANDQDLRIFADDLAAKSDAQVAFHNIHSVDVGAELDRDLMHAADEIDADLIVVGTHAPRISDYILSSHAGFLANHAKMSVFVVR